MSDLRDKIARAIHDSPTAQAQYLKAGIAPHGFENCRYSEQYFDDADAVLAVLDAVVTVDQIAEVVRAEVVAAVGECVCHEAYTSRNKRDPDCGWHWVGEDFASDTAEAIHRLYRGEPQ